MIIQNLAEQVVLIALTDGSQLISELDSITKLAAAEKDADMVVDFSDVEMITTVSINNLIKLRNLLKSRSRRLVICGLSVSNKCIFILAGLDGVFEFAPDKDAALSSLQKKT